MSPKAEIYLPKGIGPEKLKESIRVWGGQILKFREIEPIKVDAVSASTLDQFLEDQAPDHNLGPKSDYTKTFTLLRHLSYSLQEKLLVAFFTKGVNGFPNGRALGEELAKINNIDWFKPKEKPNSSRLQELADQTLIRFQLPLSPIKIIRNNWNAANSVALRIDLDRSWRETQMKTQQTAMNVARDAARATEWNEASNMAEAAEWDTTYDRPTTIWVTTAAVTWTTVADLMPQKGYSQNPFEPLIEIYRLGCWPIGPDKGDKDNFTIFIPPIKNPLRILSTATQISP